MPKNGLISNIVEALESRQLKDVYLVGISITYDNIVENFYDELSGHKKLRESLFGVIKGIISSFFGCLRLWNGLRRIW